MKYKKIGKIDSIVKQPIGRRDGTITFKLSFYGQERFLKEIDADQVLHEARNAEIYIKEPTSKKK